MTGRLILGALLTLLCGNVLQSEAFSFANYYGSSMVLHRAPRRAAVWGYADWDKVGQNVTAVLKGTSGKDQEMTTTVVSGPSGLSAVWKVLLPATPEGGPYTLTATLGADSIQLTDLLFGDVWLCSGQSNMEMQTYKTFNSSEEIQGAKDYTNIRIFMVGRSQSPEPLYDVTQVTQEWTQPDMVSVASFSSLCWSYGRKLHEHTKVPMGLVASSWGGTPIEAWSSTSTLGECYGDELEYIENNPATPYGPSEPSVLYNAMIHPLLNMTITGAIWYQGEWNARRIPTTAGYECTFPSLIRNWRRSFLAATEQTDELFPFGFVQLAGQKKNFDLLDGFPHLRWKQTAFKGRAPNSRMPNTFMAVAMDLEDFGSPYGPNHPRDKTTVSDRLLLGARAVVLGGKSVVHSGPLPVSYRYKPTEFTMELQYEKGEELERRNSTGFEICCSDIPNERCGPYDIRWTPTAIVKSDKSSVTLTTAQCTSEHVLGHRYAWRTNPCPYKRCALYGSTSGLPAPVYVILGRVRDDGLWHKINY